MSELFNTKLKQETNDCDPIYFYVRDNPEYLDIRTRVETLWKEFEPICENVNEFKVQLSKDFNSRCWEMYLGVNLKQNSNVEVIKKNNSDEPDFDIKQDGQLIHIEAICSKNSAEVKRAYDASRKSGQAMSPPDSEKILVMTGAINTKIKQMRDRLSKGIIKQETPYIIALNTGAVTFSNYELLIGALFDIGHQYLEIDRDSTEVVGRGWHKRGEITGTKDGNSKKVPANLFLSEYGKGVSAIIFSSRDIFNIPDEFGSDLYVIPNPFADKKLNPSIFKSGKDFIEDGDQLVKRTKFSARSLAISELARKIYFKKTDEVLKIAIDGVDGSGKSCLAKELLDALNLLGQQVKSMSSDEKWRARQIIHTSIDNFHNPREIRYRKGKDSPEGFFEDSFNYEAFKKKIIDPLESEKMRISLKHFDHRENRELQVEETTVSNNAIILIDGIFLNRDELTDFWDFSVFVDTDFEISVARCASRDGGSPDPSSPENSRYVNGQKLYISSCSPKDKADVIFNNNDLENPYLFGV